MKDTFWPSRRLLKPEEAIERKCTNTSSPLARLMKPKPLASLNHVTVSVSVRDMVVPPSNEQGRMTRRKPVARGNGFNGVVERLATASGHILLCPESQRPRGIPL